MRPGVAPSGNMLTSSVLPLEATAENLSSGPEILIVITFQKLQKVLPLVGIVHADDLHVDPVAGGLGA